MSESLERATRPRGPRQSASFVEVPSLSTVLIAFATTVALASIAMYVIERFGL